MTDRRLDPRQQEAVEYGDGPLLIVAGPGSGKTRVLVHRVAYMVGKRGIPASSILVTTFTKKAAEEMRERLRGLIGDEADNLWLGTVHSRCLEVLRKGGPEKVGLPRNFTVSGDDESKKIIERISKQVAAEIVSADEGCSVDDAPAISVTAAMERHGLEAMHGRISFAKEWNYGPDRVVAEFSWKRHAREVYLRYNKELRKSGLADFGDLQMLTVEMLQNDPQVRAWMQKRFSYVLVDEYQDTNAVQAQIFRLIAGAHRNITVVGDADQSIYAFRGATPQFMLDFVKEWPGAKRIDLGKNYRSTGSIVAASHALIVNNEGRFEYEPSTDNPAGKKPLMVRTPDPEGEADWIVEQVQRLHAANVPYKEMAILYRSHRLSRLPEAAFRAAKLPYEVIGGMPFFERREVKDLLAWLTLIVNPKDRDSFRRAMFAPPRGVGDITLKRLFGELDISGAADPIAYCQVGMLGSIMPKGRKAIREFGQLVDEFKRQASEPGLLSQVVDRSGYLSFLRTQDDGRPRLDNVDELCALFAEFTPPAGMENQRILAFLDWTAAELARTEARKHETDAVPMMTMHASKGSEFDTVFLIGCVNGIVPSSFSDDEDDKVEEERRLFYVGMTRAKNRLYMMAPAQRLMANGDRQPTTPSPFLYEMSEQGTTEWKK